MFVSPIGVFSSWVATTVTSSLALSQNCSIPIPSSWERNQTSMILPVSSSASLVYSHQTSLPPTLSLLFPLTYTGRVLHTLTPPPLHDRCVYSHSSVQCSCPLPHHTTSTSLPCLQTLYLSQRCTPTIHPSYQCEWAEPVSMETKPLCLYPCLL